MNICVYVCILTSRSYSLSNDARASSYSFTEAVVSCLASWMYMYVCMYVCIYVCMYVCMYVCINNSLTERAFPKASAWDFFSLFILFTVLIYLSCPSFNRYIHTYIHIYIHIHTYIHTYIYTYTHTLSQSPVSVLSSSSRSWVLMYSRRNSPSKFNFWSAIALCMYVCMYVRMYVCMYVCVYVCMYVCMYV